MLLLFVSKLFLKYNIENPQMAFFNIIFIATGLISGYYLPDYYGKLFDIFNKNIDLFMKAILYILLLNGIVYAMMEFEDYYLTIQKNKIEELTNKIIIDKIKNKFLKNPEDVVIGEKLATLNKFKDIFGRWYHYTFAYIIPYFLTITAFVIYLYKLDYMLPFLLIGFLSFSFILLASNMKLCGETCEVSANRYLSKYQSVEDYLSNLLTIHTYNEFKREDERLNDLSVSYQYGTIGMEKCTLKWCIFGTLMAMVFLFSLMYRSFTLLNKNILSKAAFLSIYFIGMGLVHTLIYLNDMLQEMGKDYTSISVINDSSDLDIFNMSEETESSSITKSNLNKMYPRIQTDSIIKAVGIDFKYPGSSNNIINGFNIDVKKGERIALIGDIGTGKSTIMKIILGIVKPTEGNLYIDGINYKTMEQKDVLKRFGYMTQNPILFNRSILDNILFGNEGVSRKQVVDLLERFGLNTVFNRLEKGIDSLVGKNGSKLSGGQRQVVWFLRIYLNNPDILLMDEPTASLSTESKEQLWKLIKEGFAGKTIIMSSHDEFLIKLATRKVKMNGY